MASVGMVNCTSLPKTFIAPSSGCLHAVQDLHQRRLAGAVLAADRVDLSLFHGEVDMVVGDDARETLRDADQLDCSCQVPSKTQKRDRTVVRSRSLVLLVMLVGGDPL